MRRDEQPWGGVVTVAERYLGRFRDPMTRALRDEIAQESAVLAWQWVGQLQDASRLDAAVRTIARRQRLRALRAHERHGRLRIVAMADEHDGAARRATRDEPAKLCIGAREMSESWALERLEGALGRLSQLDQRLLLGFYEGFCCAELSVRFRRSEACVKTRLHRARRRVQRHMEQLACDAASLEEEGTKEDQ
ncbi:MAG: RNA polymerase sigma factor [Planctomycetota bacterium]